MAPTTRGKRPAADVEPSPVPTKQPRKTRATKAKPEPNEDADETLADEVKKPAPRKARGKAGVKSETVEDEEADVVDPPKAKAAPKKGAKAKADVGPTQSDEQADAVEPDEPKAKKGRGKSKVKEEPAEDDEQVDDSKPTKAAPKKGRGKAKVKEEVAEDEDDKDVKETKAAPTTEVKEAQVAKAGTSQIPLDEGCYLTNYHVYVDPNDSLIYDAALNQTNASGNNNKFYRVQVRTNATATNYFQSLIRCHSCSNVPVTSKHGLAGDVLASKARAQYSEAVLSTMPSGTSRRSSRTNRV
jgi:hypothetical protein